MFDISTLTQLLAPLGVGTLIGAAIKRWWDKRDNTSSAKIQYDGEFMGRLLERVESLEREQKELRQEYLELMRKNAQLENENERLKGDNERLKAENRNLTSRVDELEREIREMREALQKR